MSSTFPRSSLARLRRHLKRQWPALACGLMLGTPALAAPTVAATIRPLEMIAASITDGVSTPVLVLGAGQDPHNVALRPSERRALAEADVVLWTGAMLELPLGDVMDEMGERALTVQDLEGLVLYEVEGRPDPHVWLDTRNAVVIARALAARLTALDAANAERYRANLEEFSTDMLGVESVIAQLLATTAPRPWAVYHNAFRYFERQHELPPPLALREDSNGQAGARSLKELREAMAQEDIACLMVEPSMNVAELQTVLGADLRVVTADVLGLQLEYTPDTFLLLQWNLANAFADCFQAP